MHLRLKQHFIKLAFTDLIENLDRLLVDLNVQYKIRGLSLRAVQHVPLKASI